MRKWVSSVRARRDAVPECPFCGKSNHDGKVAVLMDGNDVVGIKCHSCGGSKYVNSRRDEEPIVKKQQPPAPVEKSTSKRPDKLGERRACNLAAALSVTFGYPADKIKATWQAYNVLRGENGRTVFIYRDQMGMEIGAKCFLYKRNAKRDKETPPFWVWKPETRDYVFGPVEWNACAGVVLFESEKTALVWELERLLSVNPDKLPIAFATGGASAGNAISTFSKIAKTLSVPAFVCPDNDEPGFKWLKKVQEIVPTIQVLPLYRRLGPSEDFADYALSRRGQKQEEVKETNQLQIKAPENYDWCKGAIVTSYDKLWVANKF